MPVIHVELCGKRLVWLKSDDTDWGPLALPEHFECAERTEAGWCEMSYAHVFVDGTIMRHRQVIGTVDDLVRLAR
jgi:hypothetical protein